LVGLVYYIPIGVVSSLVLYIDQGGVLIKPQGKVALHVCFGPTQSLSKARPCPFVINQVAYDNTSYDECRQDDPIVSS